MKNNEKTKKTKRKIFLIIILLLLLLKCSPCINNGDDFIEEKEIKTNTNEKKNIVDVKNNLIKKELSNINQDLTIYRYKTPKKEVVKEEKSPNITQDLTIYRYKTPKKEVVKEEKSPNITQDLTIYRYKTPKKEVTKKNIINKSNYPEGFEEVLDNNYINTYIEVYVNNNKMGILNAEYNEENLIIKEIDIFNKYLNNFKYKKEIIKELKENIIPQKLISKKYTSIFVKNKEKLFIDDYNLKVVNIRNEQIKNSEFSVIQNLYSSYFKNDKLNYNIGGNLFVSKNNNMLITNWNKNEDNFFLNNLYFNKRSKDNEYSIGYFNYKTNNNLIIGEEFLGLEYSKKSKDINKRTNNKIQINIQRRSKVYIYREEELLLTKEYDEGIHEIKTSQFPEGSYYVDIVIDDGFIVKREKEFVQNNKLDNLYSFYVGKIKSKDEDILFKTEDDLFFKFDKTFFYKNAYITPEILYSDNNYILNTNFNYSASKNYFIDLNVLFGNKKSYGFGLNFNYNKNNLFMNYNSNILKTEDNLFIDNEITNHNINAGLSLKEKGFLNSYYSYYKTNFNKAKEFGLSYQNNYNFKFNHNINYSFNLSRRNNENFYSFQISYNFNKNNQTFRTSILNNNDNISNVNSYFNKRIKDSSFESLQYINNISDSDIFHSLSYNWADDNYGSYEHVFNYQDELSYFGNFNTNLAYNKDSYGIGGKYANNTGIIIEVESEEDSYYDVKINKEIFKVKSNKKVFIPLIADKRYEVYLSPNKKDINKYVSDKKEIIYLNKGEVEYVKRKSKNSYILITKLKKDDKVIKNATLYFNENFYFIDERGLLNINVFNGENILKINDMVCKIFIEKSEKEVIFKDYMNCESNEE